MAPDLVFTITVFAAEGPSMPSDVPTETITTNNAGNRNVFVAQLPAWACGAADRKVVAREGIRSYRPL